MLRDAQLLVGYPHSPIVGDDADAPGPADGPRPGERAPDATGLRQDAVAYPIRCHELLRHPGHTLLLWATSNAAFGRAHTIAAEVTRRVGGRVRSALDTTRRSRRRTGYSGGTTAARDPRTILVSATWACEISGREPACGDGAESSQASGGRSAWCLLLS